MVTCFILLAQTAIWAFSFALDKEGKRYFAQKQQELKKVFDEVSGATASAIKRKIIENKGLKGSAKKLAKAEQDATIELAKSKHRVARDIYKETTLEKDRRNGKKQR